MSQTVAIIGAGLIGTSCALKLAQKGMDVVLIDKSFTEQPASGGNAGIIAYSGVFSQMSPKMLLKIPFWLLDPKAMIALRPAYAFKMLPWFTQMLKSSLTVSQADFISARLSLMKSSLSDHYAQIDPIDHARFIAETGVYYIYSSQKSFAEDASLYKLRAQYGYKSEVLSESDSYKKIEGLESNVYKSIFEPDNAKLKSPMGLLKYLRDKVLNLGVKFKQANVLNIKRTPEHIFINLENGDSIKCDKIIIAAGAFSGNLTKDLGFNVPLDTERGYNVTIENPPFSLDANIIARDNQIAISPLDDGLRVGGGVEFAGINATPDYQRIDKMIGLAQKLFPSIPSNSGVKWMGCRPSMADNQPVISQHPRDKRVHFAFGHGHLGMTLAAVTAKHICNMLCDGKTDIDLTPFRVDRF